MAEFNIGANCAYRNCKRLDFLPIQCDQCKQLFCKHHSSPTVHECASTEHEHNPPRLSAHTQFTSECQLPGCNKREPVLLICEACDKAFCVGHKQKEAHACEKLWTTTDEVRVARELGQQVSSQLDRTLLETVSRPLNRSSMNIGLSLSNNSLNSRARTTAARLNLMKAKLKAKPAGRGAQVLPSDERFVLILTPPSDATSSCPSLADGSPFYVGRNWPLGKLLDFAMDHFGIKVPPDQTLGLVLIPNDILSSSEEHQLGAMDFLNLSHSFTEYERNGVLFEGSVLRPTLRPKAS
ncbi:unnamed protein product [Dicrocoelium dendriticum]|nr:unnamed protein product [Dicrocoelium dendriticum]